MHIEVMLMDDVKKLGKAGEIVKVAPGYARNCLFPKGLAAVATEAVTVSGEVEEGLPEANYADVYSEIGADTEDFGEEVAATRAENDVKPEEITDES